MPTNFYVETLSAGDIVTTATNQQSWIRDKLLINSNYSLAEEFDLTVSSTPYHVVVIKCTGINGAPDWYVTFIRNVTTSYTNILVSEEYTVGTRTFGKYIFRQTYSVSATVGTAVGNVDPTSGTVVGTVPASTCLPLENSTGSPRQMPWTSTPGISSQLFLIVYDDHFVVAGNFTWSYYVGSFDSLVTTVSETGPVGVLFLNGNAGDGSSNTTQSGTTRHPNVATAGASIKQPMALVEPQTGRIAEWQRMLDHHPTLNQNDRNLGGALFSPMFALMTTGSGSAPASYASGSGIGGHMRGRWRRLVMSGGIDGLLRGDTITYKGTTWVCVFARPTGAVGAIWADTGIAA